MICACWVNQCMPIAGRPPCISCWVQQLSKNVTSIAAGARVSLALHGQPCNMLHAFVYIAMPWALQRLSRCAYTAPLGILKQAWVPAYTEQ